tara:strand:+ start:1520 stop:2716 length:1197 start_codon:yes stop_codon:yes gene_type:complete
MKTTKENSEELDNKVKLHLSFEPHGKEHILFLKYFGDNNKYSHVLHELDKDSLKLMDDYVSEYFNLECINGSTYLGYEDYKTETEIQENVIIPVDEFELQPYNGSNRIMIDHTKKVIVDFSFDAVKILSFNPLPGNLKEDLKKIQFDGFSKKTMSSVHILAHSQERGMYLTDFKIDDKYEDLDIKSNYNDDFLLIYNSIIDNLNKDQIGLYLLHGIHGTGKTTLIRHIIRKINKRLIFISPSMATQFSNPDMIPFLMRYPNSIIIIEDSENIIKKRENGNDQSVSNLLNLSDGILGDCLKFQIICTFNTRKSDIDEALLRKGRLIESYEFGKLTEEKTNELLTKLGHPKSDKPMRLSDIYNPDENHFDTNEGTSIGFKSKKKKTMEDIYNEQPTHTEM